MKTGADSKVCSENNFTIITTVWLRSDAKKAYIPPPLISLSLPPSLSFSLSNMHRHVQTEGKPLHILNHSTDLFVQDNTLDLGYWSYKVYM